VSRRPSDDDIPTLTDVVSFDTSEAPPLTDEALAELQAELTARVFQLAEELMHDASKEIEALMFERVCDRLRAQLPDLVDQVLRDRLIK
jgi:hypothetical protein